MKKRLSDVAKKRIENGSLKTWKEMWKEKGFDCHPSKGKKAGEWKVKEKISLSEAMETMFVENSPFRVPTVKKLILRHRLIKLKCGQCGVSKWRGRQLPLQLHHKNGNSLDQRLSNIEFMCPNCHSMTENHSKKKESTFSEADLREAISTCSTLQEVAASLGLAIGGSTYYRIKSSLYDLGINLNGEELVAV